MDSVTHIVLGGAIAQIIASKHAGFARAFLTGAVAATLPDMDVFLHTGNVVRDHALHRHFLHSLPLVPVLALITWLLFGATKQLRPHWKPVYLAALIACLSHTLLDAMTSYGTVMLWPLTEHRYALDWVAVVDPLVTLPLIAGTLIAWRKKAIRPAAIGLAAASVYLSLAAVQHERASAAQRELLAARGITDATNARVLPQLGTILCYRSLYLHEGRIYADAIRPGVFSGATVKPGSSVSAVDVTDLRPFPASAEMTSNFDNFNWFADGYVARMPDQPEILGDVRYTRTPETMQAIWGVQLEGVDQPQWIMRVRIESIRSLVLDTFRPRGYVPIAQLPATP